MITAALVFLANVKGKATHKTVKDALLLLENLEHRGGQGDEENTGDGAGILTQIPHEFFFVKKDLFKGKKANMLLAWSSFLGINKREWK